MACCKEEMQLLEEAKEAVKRKEAILKEWEIKLIFQQNYSRTFEDAGVDVIRAARKAKDEAKFWVDSSRAALAVALSATGQLQNALAAAENAYNNTQGSSPGARQTAYYAYLTALSAYDAAMAYATTGQALLKFAEIALAKATVMLAYLLAMGTAYALPSYAMSKAWEEYLIAMVARSQMDVYSADNARLTAQRNLNNCHENAKECILCGLCVHRDDLTKCTGCQGLYCDGCFDPYIEERELEIRSYVGSGF